MPLQQIQLPKMAPTRSILRVASTQNTATTNNSKRVTFADEVRSIFYPGPRKSRPQPPSTIPPATPPPSGRSSPKQSPRESPRRSPRDSPRSSNLKQHSDNAPSPRMEKPSKTRENLPRARPSTPPRPRASNSKPRADESPRTRPESPRLRAETPAKPRADIRLRPRVENPMRARVDMPLVATNTTSSVRTGSLRRRRHRHRHHDNCRHCKRHERRERRRREKEMARYGTDMSIIGSDVASERAERVARERRKYEAGVVKRRTSAEARRENRAKAVVGSVSRLVDIRPRVVKANARNGVRNVVRATRNADQGKLNDATERARNANVRRRVRNSDQQEAANVRGQGNAAAGGRRRRSERREDGGRREDRRRDDIREREARLKTLKTSGALTKARRFVAKSLALNRDGYPADMLDLIDAKTIFKLYLRCRERTRKGDDLLFESGQRLEEAKLRRKMMDEEAELKSLEREASESDPASVSSERRVLKKKRSGLQHFAADELGSNLSSMKGLSKGQLDRAVLAAAIARADRFETYRYDGASYY